MSFQAEGNTTNSTVIWSPEEDLRMTPAPVKGILLPQEDLYSIPQQKAMTLIGTISALISLLGSALILCVIYLERRKLLKRVYHRILMGMSVMDSIAGLGSAIMGGWAVTKGAPNQVWANGTIGTCNALGFFVHMHMSTLMYSAVLSIYFLLAIRFEKTDDWVQRRAEPILHLLAVGFPISTAIAAMVMKLMNPIQILPGWCWIQPNPPACKYHPEVVTCERGENYQTLNRISNTGVAFLGFITVTLNMCWIWWTVRTRERQFQQRFPDARLSSSTRTSLSHESATNAFLYTGAFFLTYLAPAIGVVVFSRLEEEIRLYRTQYFWGWVWTKVFFPLQGFFNAMIYLRPRWARVQGDKQLKGTRAKLLVMLNPEWRNHYLQESVPCHWQRTTTTKEVAHDEAKVPERTQQLDRTSCTADPTEVHATAWITENRQDAEQLEIASSEAFP